MAGKIGLLTPDGLQEVLGAGFEGEGVELAAPVDQGDPCAATERPVFKEPAQGGSGFRLVDLFDAAVVAFFFEKFKGGQKEVMKVAPEGVEFDKLRSQIRIVEPLFSQQFADVGAVFCSTWALSFL